MSLPGPPHNGTSGVPSSAVMLGGTPSLSISAFTACGCGAVVSDASAQSLRDAGCSSRSNAISPAVRAIEEYILNILLLRVGALWACEPPQRPLWDKGVHGVSPRAEG